MKTVLLLRHAKSSWKDSTLSDHDRPLNKRGRGAAPVIGTWLIANGFVPDIILSSTSERTRETLRRLGLPDGPGPEISFDPDLYGAGPDTMFAILRKVDKTHDTAMIVAHEPGLSTFARTLASEIEPGCEAAFVHFPTAALAVLHTDILCWTGLSPGQAVFSRFVKPRDLVADT